MKVWNPQSYSLSYHASSKHIHCSLMHGSYLSIIWSFWPISSSFALKYEFHLSLSSLEGLTDLEACPDEFEYASPEMLSGLWRRTLVPSLTCPRGAGYPTEVVAIVEEVEIPETLLYTKSGWTNTYHTCTPSLLFHHAISSFYPTVFSENFQRSCRFPHNTQGCAQRKIEGSPVLQPSKLKFLLGRHLPTNSVGLGRLFYKSSRQHQNCGAMATKMVVTWRVVLWTCKI